MTRKAQERAIIDSMATMRHAAEVVERHRFLFCLARLATRGTQARKPQPRSIKSTLKAY